MNVSNHTVLITGGSRGIGFELAKKFCDLGNRVIICGRSSEHLANAKKQLKQLVTIQCDVAQQDDLNRLVETLQDQHGDISLVINSAGVSLNYDFSLRAYN